MRTVIYNFFFYLFTGEFTPEAQQRLKAEEEKEQSKIDPWKAKHFEPVWGQRCVLTNTHLIHSKSYLIVVCFSTFFIVEIVSHLG